MHFIIYGKKGCPHCNQAIDFLKDREQCFSYYFVSREAMDQYKFKTYPQVFVQTIKGEQHIGGFKDLEEWYDSKIQEL
jgi:glutaredoxin